MTHEQFENAAQYWNKKEQVGEVHVRAYPRPAGGPGPLAKAAQPGAALLAAGIQQL